jgi:hypothetical protein
MKITEVIQHLQSKIDKYKFLLRKYPDLEIRQSNKGDVYSSNLIFDSFSQKGEFNKIEFEWPYDYSGMPWRREQLYFIYVFEKSGIEVRSKESFWIDYEKYSSFDDCLNQWNFSDEIQLKIKNLLNKDDILEIDEDLRDNND